MKKLFYFFLIIALSKNVLAINFPERIMSSYRLNDIFKIKEQLKIEKLTDQQRLFLSAVVNNAFALNNKSTEEINKYINDYPEEYSDTLYIGLLQVQLDNYIKLNNYAEAANIENTILTKAASALKEKEITDNKNSFRIWNALRNSKPQEVIKNGKPVIEYTKDVANLINVVAECNNIKQHAIFDTGANLSVITDSLAAKMGIIPLGDSITVKAITGAEVISQIAVAKELKIGGITIKNAVFLIMPTEALSFGTVYKIDMIIGFPIIKAFGQVEFDLKDQRIIVSDDELKEERNMFLDGLTPAIKIVFENDYLLFTFDSGAKTTHFNKLFLSTLKNYPEYKLYDDSIKMGGAGGVQVKKTYRLDNVSCKVLEKTITLKNCIILKEDFLEGAEKKHGNLGQDIISSGKGFIIDFKNMVFKILD